MKKYALISKEKVDVEKIFRDYFSKRYVPEKSIFIDHIDKNECKVTIIIAEFYYFRINDNLSTTIIVEENPGEMSIKVIASGGGVDGDPLGSLGAEKNAGKRIVKLLEENGFTLIK